MAKDDSRDPQQTHPYRGGGASGDELSVRGFALEQVDGDGEPLTWEAADVSCTVGSHDSCDLVLADPTVSRFHCELSMTDDGARIRDLGSRNGTIVDGTRLLDGYLKGGSLIRLGRTVLRFQFLGRAIALRVSERTRMDRLVGSSVAMRAAFAVLERAAATRSTTLLQGETGTGKTAAARAIHRSGDNADQPFVVVDCGAIPEQLLESELFGHERGAFTGAVDSRAGAFEEVGAGTIFLDEIGELPPSLQPKLLGVIENRSFRRVGGNNMRPMQARVICATNRDLRADVNAGRFREDLYFRIAVVTLTLPPLRQRPEDIADIAAQLLTDLGASAEESEKLLTPELIGQLRRAAWPGNVRELRNYLEQCLVFQEPLPAPPAVDTEHELPVDLTLPLTEARERVVSQFERAYLGQLLRAHGGVVSRAARAAGVDRTYLYKLLRRYKE